MRSVLVLNSDYTPINVCSAKRAIIFIVKGKVEVVQSYDDYFHYGNGYTIQVPSIVRLRKQIKKPYFYVPLSRKNIHIRDNYTCQYCGQRVDKPTVDHIIPQTRNGPTSWENLVASCFKCNNTKGEKSLEEVGFKLLKKPTRPVHAALFKCKAKVENYDIWKDYLYNS